MAFINANQIKIIHTLKSKMKLPEEHYRDMLAGYDVTSSKDLSFTDAVAFIMYLSNKAEKMGIPVNTYTYTPRYHSSNLGNRDGYAYPGQLKKIYAIWCSVSRMETDEEKRKALNAFLKNKFKIDRIEWLPRDMVGKVIKSISSIKKVSHANS